MDQHFEEQTAVQREIFRQLKQLFDVVVFGPPLDGLTAEQRAALLGDFKRFSSIDEKLYNRLLAEHYPDVFGNEAAADGSEESAEEAEEESLQGDSEPRESDEFFSEADGFEDESDEEIFEDKLFGLIFKLSSIFDELDKFYQSFEL